MDEELFENTMMYLLMAARILIATVVIFNGIMWVFKTETTYDKNSRTEIMLIGALLYTIISFAMKSYLK